jgi:hypothetical protein
MLVPNLRRSGRKTKKAPLFPGLVATPIKTRSKPRTTTQVTPRALKLALAEAGLEKCLEREAMEATPLDANTIHKIANFVSVPLTDALAANSGHAAPLAQPAAVMTSTVTASHSDGTPSTRLTLQDLGFPPSEDEGEDDMDLEGINLDDIDPDSEDEDLFDVYRTAGLDDWEHSFGT